MAQGADCSHMASCSMYEMLKLAGSLAVWKANYCTGDHARCERYKVAALGRPVPANLMPNGALLRFPANGGAQR